MISAIVAVAVFGLVVAVIVLVARDRGPTPADIAMAYEQAWDRLDFDTLWTLSGPEMRDGLDRRAYTRAKSEAYAKRRDLGHLAEAIVVDDESIGIAHAVVRTRVVLRDGGVVRNDVALAKRQSGWEITGYELVGTPARPS